MRAICRSVVPSQCTRRSVTAERSWNSKGAFRGASRLFATIAVCPLSCSETPGRISRRVHWSCGEVCASERSRVRELRRPSGRGSNELRALS